ncbi:tRNA (adenosine(37)-N6)-threonylcarbamoyltransferase complex dimerization subunit type 1 TsaB [Brucella pseudogrignonensis]|uniref:tRNA (adenosine(37)-N6)-threonylcarbamoyltransferase complex dimerization subunit type 1 TsaB n=1 Tax=Brucella pseudogrignonensis TaxID=419475 RepID=UPI00190DE565|nr:tRNA (adenosine(37)-N6)-threonylcarbamoyltransferase complex dimerization subunit type 1 TsaB [Brucella pseudogrignonensis]MBK0019959.1 tRNA (adenosine(37)-N6)-threonylcarbamoyltransferase complex dimerization subunit type 1 TsaB [Ochrobactrum sp. S45]MBK0043301.1 tRNA (adenosine(37)-N6)-threonylcarbamoyltransferase complex dimerization subunit type 1 TsaB [Ochrobactrum sp. S46]UKK92317.1 tRNA (adenosine(37)-N6)-threonylcarbamoyltransferase complex dimerization subunit type 1 TsaB [Brucella p
MKILALDTASSWCAAAVYDSGTNMVLAEISENIGKGHAEVLMDYIGQAMMQSGIAMAELDRVAVNVGPGSFTGVRIGVSAARGFALALDRPALGVSAFDALASEIAISHPGQPVLVLLEAHRGEIYAQAFGADGMAITGPMVLAREEALALIQQQSSDTILAGSAAAALNETQAGSFSVARGEPTARIGTYAKLAALHEPGEAPKPLYMRGPDVKPQTGFALPRKAGGE